jgi:hypothetical protein
MTEERVVVDQHLTIQRHDAFILGDDQRVDLRQGCVGRLVSLPETVGDLSKITPVIAR